MLKLKRVLTATGLLTALACFGAAPADAHPVTYVSGKGSDSNDCFSPATPCRSFQRAVNQTVAGGEVKALDPADYQPVTITKSITITGVQGAGIDTNGGTAVTITLNQGGNVYLDHLIIKSGGIGAAGGSLKITHCTIEGAGIGLSNMNFLIADTVITDGSGIVTRDAAGTLDHDFLIRNTTGVLGQTGSSLSIVDTIASGNGTGFNFGGLGSSFVFVRSTIISNGTGVFMGGGPASFASSTIENNGTGINNPSGSTATSFGDNHIKGNGTDVSGGSLTKVGTQ